MSKTSQRKREMFRQGQDDYLAGRPFRWSRHPLIEYYQQGYFEAKREMALPMHKLRTFWQKFLFLIGIRK